jgi:hypothetical protein
MARKGTVTVVTARTTRDPKPRLAVILGKVPVPATLKQLPGTVALLMSGVDPFVYGWSHA